MLIKTLIMLLNLRSHLMAYRPMINAPTLWDNQAPQQLLLQAFNRYGFSVSILVHSCYCLSEESTKDAVRLASSVANDHTKVKLFPYNKFRMTKCWPCSLCEGSNAVHLANVAQFAHTAGTRHRISQNQA